jgi:very-short-patch-repair endonuclease
MAVRVRVRGNHKMIQTINRAKVLRKKATEAETQLWYFLRNRRLKGYKFKRQEIINPYIVDFICPYKKLIIELDGGQHALSEDYDQRRTAFLEKQGYKVVRFWNHEVFNSVDEVLDVILVELQQR